MRNFIQWVEQNNLVELNFEDGGDTSHALLAIAAAMAGGLGGGAVGGVPGAVAGFLGSKELMSRMYPADGRVKRKMKKK